MRKPNPSPATDGTVSDSIETKLSQLRAERTARTNKVVELTWAEIDRFTQGLARTIAKTFKPEVVIGVAHGGVFVGRAIATELGCAFYPVRISRRSRDKQVWHRPRLFGEMPAEIKGKRVLTVDDVASSGDTLQLAHSLAIKGGAAAAFCACLVTRAGGFQPDWTALSSAELVVFPWDYEPVNEDDRFDFLSGKAGS